MNKKIIAQKYKDNYSASHKQTIHEYDIPFQAIKKYIKDYPLKANVLDAGCGNGRYCKKLSHNGYKNIYAVDFFKSDMNDINFLLASVDQLPFCDNSFDFIYSLSVIHYLDDLNKGICELGRVLRPGGTLILTFFNKHSLYTILRKLKRNIIKNTKYSLDKLQFLNPEAYETILRKNGFSIIEVNGYLFPQYTQLLNYLNNYGVNTKYAPPIYLSKNPISSHFKSVFGYHAIIVARLK
ncbi:MAG: class I SAM-dependent methyltransferase [Thermodesulfobacteriota bacterium]|nr:class I SAM-dependent methyltransferase [Thermodesulfobacteriota bacterium]